MTDRPGAESVIVRPQPAADRLRHSLALLAIWLIGSALLLFMCRDDLASGLFSDSDDYMRLQEARDWMAGQSWFDVTQYRINPPAGLPMHWSRLVDLPLASAIALLRPLVGTAEAEILACAWVPLITLGVVGLLIAAMTRRMMGPRLALVAMAFAMITPEMLWAARPMRIDHHGWQLACAVAMALALIGNLSIRRAAVAGLCAALWMHISLEGLPFTVACGAWLGLRWLIAPAEQRWRLPAFLGAGALGSLGLFLIAHGGALFDRTFCDAVSPVHIVMLAIAAAGTCAASVFAPRHWLARAAILGVTATLCALSYRLWAPQCAGGPFAALDPLSYRLWYLTIPEGLPIWKQTPQLGTISIAYPLVGLAGCVFGWRRAPAAQRGAWLDLSALLLAAILIAVMLARASSLSNALAIPGALALIPAATAAMRRSNNLLLRVMLGAGASLIALPPTAALIAIAAVPDKTPRPHNLEVAIATAQKCATPANLVALDQLPKSLILAPLDESPTLIVDTHHMTVGAGYHRGGTIMHDQISAWIGDEANARRIIARHGPSYLFFCPGDAEMRLMAKTAPNGFAAQLNAGHAPDWLHPVSIPGLSGKLYAITR